MGVLRERRRDGKRGRKRRDGLTVSAISFDAKKVLQSDNV